MMASKADLREKALRYRSSVTPAELVQKSRVIARSLFALPEMQEARVIASYVAKHDEVQTAPIIERILHEGRRVVVPRAEKDPKQLLFFEISSLSELSPGNFGVLEPPKKAGEVPVPLSETGAVLVPVVAWDDRGNRIGYGKGYFDSVLASRGNSYAIGLGLEVQRVQRIPATEKDVPLDIMVSEKGVLRFWRKTRR